MKKQLMDVAVLPGDLMVEILVRLTTVKSLLRFKSVSKAWQHIIISPKFITEHLIHQKQKKDEIKYLHLYKHVPDCEVHSDFRTELCPEHHNRVGISLISKGDHDYDDPIITNLASSFPDDFNGTVVSTVGSSNGLVCFNFSRQDDKMNSYLGVWNPSTRKFKTLPNPRICSWNLDPCSTSVSFSYIPCTGSYKLVKILVYMVADQGKNDRYVARVHVFSMGANSWREVLFYGAKDERFHELPGFIGNKPGVANGCLYWFGNSLHTEASMLIFDMEKEVFRQTCMPYPLYSHSDFSWSRCVLTVFGEDLVMLTYVYRGTKMGGGKKESDLFLEAWIYNGMNESWIEKIKLGSFPKDDRPIGYWGSREMIIGRNYCDDNGSSYAYLYNLYSKVTRSTFCHERGCNLVLYPYIESLVQV